jgi:hypothetical protein
MKCVIRFRGSQALSGIIKYEIKARIVTPAMIIGASHKKLAFTLRGRRRGTYRIATTHPFQNTPMNWNGLLHRPKLHAGLGKRFGVQNRRPRQIRP